MRINIYVCDCVCNIFVHCFDCKVGQTNPGVTYKSLAIAFSPYICIFVYDFLYLFSIFKLQLINFERFSNNEIIVLFIFAFVGGLLCLF